MISLILLGFLPLSVYQQNMDFFMELHIVACVHSEFHLLFVVSHRLSVFLNSIVLRTVLVSILSSDDLLTWRF